jgi:uncharacterized protein
MSARVLCLKSCFSALDTADPVERFILKYAVVILVVLLGVWLWRKNRADAQEEKQQPSSKPAQRPSGHAQPQIMLSCAVCGVHLPQSDAWVGKQGSYCSAAHRQQKES